MPPPGGMAPVSERVTKPQMDRHPLTSACADELGAPGKIRSTYAHAQGVSRMCMVIGSGSVEPAHWCTPFSTYAWFPQNPDPEKVRHDEKWMPEDALWALSSADSGD